MKYIIRIDDFPMDNKHLYDNGLVKFKQLDEVFKKYNVPYILGVIPSMLTNEASQYLLENKARITPAMHGYEHHKIKDNQMRSEFIEISFDEKLKKLKAGIEVYSSWLHEPPTIFIPPMNWFDKDMVKILKIYGFEYILGFGIEKAKDLGAGLTYIPCSPKFYNPANKIQPMVEEVMGVDGISFLTLHCNWEYPLSSAPETLLKTIKEDIVPLVKLFDAPSKPMPLYRGIAVSRRMGFDWILERITSGYKILDFGCGASALPTILSLKGNIVTAVDINKERLEKQKANMEGWNTEFSIVEADGRQLPFTDESFDIVTASHSIQHTMDDDVVVMKELCRILRPRGHILMANKLSNRESYIETNRADPLKLRNWLDVESEFVIKNGLTIIDKAFLNYNFNTDRGEWCGEKEANAYCLEVRK